MHAGGGERQLSARGQLDGKASRPPGSEAALAEGGGRRDLSQKAASCRATHNNKAANGERDRRERIKLSRTEGGQTATRAHIRVSVRHGVRCPPWRLQDDGGVTRQPTEVEVPAWPEREGKCGKGSPRVRATAATE